LIILAITLLAYACLYSSKEIKEAGLMMGNKTASNATIIIVYDNYEYDSRLKTGFGFSCLVKLKDKNILFDTGSDSPTLLSNMEKLELNPKEIDTIVLSHIHGDHTGGLSGVLEINPNVEVYIPQSFPDSFKGKIISYDAKPVDVRDLTKIYNGIYSTGEFGTWVKEQSLIVKTDKGLVVITGCAHPGIVNIVKKTKELTKESVYLVVGGFHLGSASDNEIRNIVESFRELEVKKVFPCHCTGSKAIKAFEEEYKEDFIKAGVGRKILVE